MRRPQRAWYVVLAVAALIPAGMRAVTWKRVKPVPVDETMARAGEILFKHVWTPNDPLAKGGDGLGPVFNDTSCAACHERGGVGGSGGLKHNVTTFVVRQGTSTREGVVHARAVRYPETLAQLDSSLPAISQPSLEQVVQITGRSNNQCIALPSNVSLSQRNTPALFGAKLIDAIPERVILAQEKRERLKWGLASAKEEDVPVGRAARLRDGRIGRFGWKAQSASLRDFVQAACANELGLGNPGQAQPRPIGYPGYQPPGLDLTQEQCDQLTAFCAALPRPVSRLPEDSVRRDQALAGEKLFGTLGCADCHTPSLGGVDGIYSDLLLHRMGRDLVGGGSYNEPPPPQPEGTPGEPPSPGEWRTPPLWGVADSAPYLHDGRAPTLHEAIVMHGGQGTAAAQRYQRLAKQEQAQLIEFLSTLKAP
jgi:CxxC motif-containing protein (DUF1111 family)